MKINKINKVKERLRLTGITLSYMSTLPEKNLYPDLATWRGRQRVYVDNGVNKVRIEPMFEGTGVPLDCGSIACLGGWLPAMPEMREKGVRATAFCAPMLVMPTNAKSGRTTVLHHYALAHELFGEEYLLEQRGGCAFDDELPSCVSDLDIVLHRLERNAEELQKKLVKLEGKRAALR
jgi:hypothetical protein